LQVLKKQLVLNIGFLRGAMIKGLWVQNPAPYTGWM
jgi:hypothetical protein